MTQATAVKSAQPTTPSPARAMPPGHEGARVAKAATQTSAVNAAAPRQRPGSEPFSATM